MGNSITCIGDSSNWNGGIQLIELWKVFKEKQALLMNVKYTWTKREMETTKGKT